MSTTPRWARWLLKGAGRCRSYQGTASTRLPSNCFFPKSQVLPKLLTEGEGRLQSRPPENTSRMINHQKVRGLNRAEGTKLSWYLPSSFTPFHLWESLLTSQMGIS